MRLFELFSDTPGTYVSATFSDQTKSDLLHYQQENDIPNPVPEDDFHCTIISSRIALDWAPEKDLDIKAKPKKFEVWPTGEDRKCLVLQIESDYLRDRFEDAMRLGATHDFESYIPHVTLSYDVGDFDASSLGLPDFALSIVEEHAEPRRTSFEREDSDD